jgi:hypothetical protein
MERLGYQMTHIKWKHLRRKKKVRYSKDIPVPKHHVMKTYGEVSGDNISYVCSELDAGELSTSCFGHFTTGEGAHSNYVGRS